MSLLSLQFVNNAEAIIGMPWTPLSFAGVARRSMYREAAWSAAAANAAAANAAAANAAAANAAAANAAAANAAAAQRAAAPGSAVPLGTIVPSLPSGCNSTVIGGVNYFDCAGVYYRAGSQGNKIVYIVSKP
jgi:membrane protein involved in colicin uptake